LVTTVKAIDILRAAYASGLRRFVVLKSGTKEPIENDWQEAKPVESAEKLLDVLRDHPQDCNYGAVTSKLTNLILDFDSIDWLFDNWPVDKFPETFIVRTGRSGVQMHFLQTELSRQKLRNAALKNPNKGVSTNVLEVLFDRRQGLLPGCFVKYDNPDIGTYKELTPGPLLPIPDYVVEWICKLLDKTSPILKPGQVRSVRPDLDIEEKLKDAGLKSTRLVRDGKVYLNHHDEMAMCLVKGAPHTDNKGNNRCSAFVFDPETGAFWYQCFAGACVATPRKTKKALAMLGLKLDDLLVEPWRRFYDSKADFEKAGDLVWQIEGISYQGEVTGNVALQKHGKSWYILSKIKALLGPEGSTWMGHKVVKARRVVLFIPEVGRSSMYRRLKLMRLDQYLDKTLFVSTSAHGVPDLENHEIMDSCAGADVFMDTLIRFLEGPENNAEVISAFAEKVFALLAVARNVEINAHTTKNYDKGSDMGPEMFRGSTDITAFLSNGYGLMQIDKPTNTVFVKSLFSRDLPEDLPSFILQGKPWIDKEGDFRITDANAGDLKDHKKNDPLKNCSAAQQAQLKELHAQGLALRPIAERMDVKSHNTVRAWLKALGLTPNKAKPDKPEDLADLPFPGGEQ
jgi:hypothetical protein